MTGYFYLCYVFNYYYALKNVIHYTKPGDCESKGRFFYKTNRFVIRIESNRFESRIGMLYYARARL